MNNTSLRLRLPLLVLLASIALTAVAAFDAQRAIRAQDKVVARALSEIGSFASWSYGQHLQEQLGNAAREVLGAINHGDNLHTGRQLPPAKELVHYLYLDNRCNCHRTRRGPLPANFLAFKLGSDSLDVAINTHLEVVRSYAESRVRTGLYTLPIEEVNIERHRTEVSEA